MDALYHFSSQVFFLLSGGLGFIGHPLAHHVRRVLQRSQFSFYRLEHFQERNSLLGCQLVFCN